MDPIQIKPGDSGRLIVHIPYSPGRVAKIKTVIGRRWHQQDKHWTVPQANGTLSHLLALFAGEQVEVGSSLRLALAVDHREPPPTDPRPELLDRVRLAIRARHYSHRTDKTYVGWIRRFVAFHRHRAPWR